MAFFSRKPAAFTLIELLIVVAIIAILAAIAVPNFLEAQTRAKVARAKNDLRVVTTGLESYRIDHNNYPMMNSSARMLARPGDNPVTQVVLERITTPIAYLTSRGVFADPFKSRGVYETTGFTTREMANLPDPTSLIEYFYTTRGWAVSGTRSWQNLQVGSDEGAKVEQYILESAGPDQYKYYLGAILNSNGTSAYYSRCFYDPTNGTVSEGSIWRLGGTPEGRGAEFCKMAAVYNK